MRHETGKSCSWHLQDPKCICERQLGVQDWEMGNQAHIASSRLESIARPHASTTPASSPPHTVGCDTLSGTCGRTSTTALIRSSTTWGPVFCPICLISSSFFCVSCSACSSACLLPEVCCTHRQHGRISVVAVPRCLMKLEAGWLWSICSSVVGALPYLLLECLELVLLLLAVVLNLLLRL